jgi:hypothetical protein
MKKGKGGKYTGREYLRAKEKIMIGNIKIIQKKECKG